MRWRTALCGQGPSQAPDMWALLLQPAKVSPATTSPTTTNAATTSRAPTPPPTPPPSPPPTPPPTPVSNRRAANTRHISRSLHDGGKDAKHDTMRRLRMFDRYVEERRSWHWTRRSLIGASIFSHVAIGLFLFAVTLFTVDEIRPPALAIVFLQAPPPPPPLPPAFGRRAGEAPPAPAETSPEAGPHPGDRPAASRSRRSPNRIRPRSPRTKKRATPKA